MCSPVFKLFEHPPRGAEAERTRYADGYVMTQRVRRVCAQQAETLVTLPNKEANAFTSLFDNALQHRCDYVLDCGGMLLRACKLVDGRAQAKSTVLVTNGEACALQRAKQA